jgi:hypothetical protein
VDKKENIVATTITEITECFEYFFSSLYRREFVKTLRLNECSERELLPLVRCYLLGWFADNVSPEVKSKLPGTVSGHGYIDFVIDDVAVEFAVRKPTAARSNVSATVNSTEVKKLMKHDGKALLVLFDFSDTPYSEEQIESFRNWPSLVEGITASPHSTLCISLWKNADRWHWGKSPKTFVSANRKFNDEENSYCIITDSLSSPGNRSSIR